MKTFLKVWLGIGLIAIGFGIIILIITVGIGGLRHYNRTYTINEQYDNITSVDMEIGYGKVTIEEGSEFSIQASNLIDNQIKSYVDSNGTWIVKENGDNNIDFFGANINLENIFYWNDDVIPQIIITIPKDFTAKDFNFHIGAGQAKVDMIRANEGSFTVGAGELEIEQLEIKNQSVYSIGTGQMILSQMNAANISVDCGVGDVLIEGSVFGDNNVKCGIGSVELKLTTNEEDYSYQITSGIGDVSINNKSYHQIANEVISNDGAEHNLNLDCGIGNINVDFN